MAENRSVLTRQSPPPALSVRYGAGPDQLADVWPGEDGAAGRPLAVLIHGGFWRPAYDRVHSRPMATALHAAGWSVVSLEYRREPGLPGAAVDDVCAALAAVPGELARRGVAFDGTVVVVGHSAGGHLALLSAATAPAPGLAGTLALAPVADLRLAHALDLDEGAVRDFLGGPPADAAGLDPVRLPAPSTPVVIVHGTEDVRVPAALGEAYAAAHPATRFLPVDGAGHFELIDPLTAVWPVVTEALAGLARR
ncbi:alpha/beta hydrolase family protein [Streptomyces hoynatensis]|uniref:Alpha/beta hydrolase n=1 Tax=Streptomyces hoynatensis TaxID=1141874 RepID=A0A3A9ZFM7_9ACTN|nr:alpha/beta hydrolase [Streptomyces hoynatensis]RKN47120.1 alpha/beta hydrolase [Streptomyces hoynatensis]